MCGKAYGFSVAAVCRRETNRNQLIFIVICRGNRNDILVMPQWRLKAETLLLSAQ
jgi:hypothetical protein